MKAACSFVNSMRTDEEPLRPTDAATAIRQIVGEMSSFAVVTVLDEEHVALASALVGGGSITRVEGTAEEMRLIVLLASAYIAIMPPSRDRLPRKRVRRTAERSLEASMEDASHLSWHNPETPIGYARRRVAEIATTEALRIAAGSKNKRTSQERLVCALIEQVEQQVTPA
jgi:hypothetical protein